jgi:AAA15 family ATPase/GTPase
MSNLIQHLRIQNFKSVRDLSLECDRINIFIGKPNAGKSNVLEAISLLGQGYSSGKFMGGLVRYNQMYQMFNNFDDRNTLSITTDSMIADLKKLRDESFHFSIEPLSVREYYEKKPPWEVSDDQYEPFSGYKDMYVSNYDDESRYDRYEDFSTALVKQTRDITIQPDGQILKSNLYGHSHSPVKKYEFKLQSGRKDDLSYLIPPHGGNFYRIARSQQELRKEIQDFLNPNGLELLLDEENSRVLVAQREATSLLSFPLHLVPDTFQRYIFHLAAIMSNRDSVLLFEEPESHSYAPYVYQLAQHILNDEGRNQYFITTHSPYFLLPLMQEGKDVAVFATWFEDYQTHARRLTEEEIGEMLDYGVDVFMNLDHFTPA